MQPRFCLKRGFCVHGQNRSRKRLTQKDQKRKKQIKSSVHAHFLWSASILLLLLVICVIPFALAQRQIGASVASEKPTGITCTPGWSAGPDLPFAGVRFVGVFFPANGKFYAMGGRDASNVEFTHPFEYDPVTNMWTTKSASYPDAFTNNMGCGILTESGTPYIYCAGGSNFTSQTTSGRVFRYDPVADSISVVAAPWPLATKTFCRVVSPYFQTSSTLLADSTLT
jgi:hypothetical protein